MDDKMIETTENVDTVSIKEKSKDLVSLWSQLKESSNRWVWLGLLTLGVSLPLMIPYVFLGSYATFYFVGVTLLALVVMYIAFASNFCSNLVKLNKFVFIFMSVIALSSLYQMLNFDKHVLVDYYERIEDFPYSSVTKELANPLMSDIESFTISVKSVDVSWNTPNFDNLVNEVRSGSKTYEKNALDKFNSFTIYYGLDAQGRIGDIKGKRTVYGWFGSTSTDFVIELER